MQILFLIIAGGLLYYFYKNNSPAINISSQGNKMYTEKEYNSIASYVEQTYLDLVENFDAVSLSENTFISYKDLLAIICIETGALLQKGKQGFEIIGDVGLKNKAFGLMQIRKPALDDTNNYFHLGLTENDLLNDYNNINVGSHYLQICYLRASAKKSKDIRSLAVRMYNGGTSANDENNISLQYLNNFNNFRKYII